MTFPRLKISRDLAMQVERLVAAQATYATTFHLSGYGVCDETDMLALQYVFLDF